MKNISIKMNRIFTSMNSNTFKVIVMVAILVLFVLTAGAPNATIGIGK
jgi:hypothetical protein